jgi:23S rRNA (uracil1939-C5)-methyltransferase
MIKTGLTGQKVRLKLEGWGRLGEALATLEGKPVFVIGGAPGEEVEAEVVKERRHYIAAVVTEVLEASPHRVATPCPYFGPCTGCQWQHLDYEFQLQIKRDMVSNALRRVGGFEEPPVSNTLPSPKQYGYRNHARFTIGQRDDTGKLGYVNRETRRFVPIDHCMIMHPGINEILGQLQRHAAETSQLSVRYGVNSGDFLIQPTLKTPEVSLPTGQKHYKEKVRGREFRVASPSFFQVNVEQLSRMVDLVRERLGLTGSEFIVDAYAGVGTFAVLLAPYAGRIVAIEDSPAAVDDAKANGQGLDNVEFRLGKTEDALRYLGEWPDAVILDPPRKGCHPAAIEALEALAPPRVVYVSCDPATLGRDLKMLCNRVFHLEEVQPVDMFPQTHHVECLATLSLRRPVESLVMASASLRRRGLAALLGVAMEVETSGVSEEEDGDDPRAMVRRLALAKAQVVASRRPGRLVVGADTTVVLEERNLGKPGSEEEAVEMLRALRGREHTVITGVAVVDESGKAYSDVCESKVTLDGYSDEEARAYITSGQAMDKAGGYGVQDAPFASGARVERCYNNVIGLPLCILGKLLHRAGYRIDGLAALRCCGANLG